MATAARFGRLPRRATSLTAAIVAAAREYQNMRERNLRSAWENGGDFEGKKATDEMLLDFYREKLKDLDPNDPAANEVRNQIAQYTFSIENSEMELKYAQNKVSDQQMAAFYKEWAAKLPTNSEAYRERMRLAAAYQDRAQSTGRARSSGASETAYQNRQSSIYNSTRYAYEVVVGSALAYARSGIIGRINPVLDTDAEGWADLRVAEGDAGNFLDILQVLGTAPEYEEWRKEVVAAIRQVNPGFNATDLFSQTGLLALNRQSIAGINQQIAAARRAGRKGDVTSLTKARDEAKGVQISISTMDEKAIYEDSRSEWDEVLNDPSSTVIDRWEATDKYSQTLLNLAERAKAAGDDIGAGRYNTEYLATKGQPGGKGPTMWEASRPTAAGERNPDGNDAATTAESVRQMVRDLDRLTQTDEMGRPLFVQVNIGKNGPTADTTAKIGVVPTSALANAIYIVDPGDATKSVTIGDVSLPANTLYRAVMPVPITAVAAKVDERGQLVEQVGRPAVLGNQYTLPSGDNIWAYVDSEGQTKYALSNPFIGNPERTADGYEIVTPVEDDVAAAAIKKAGGPDYQKYTDPNYYSAEANKRMPNMVVNSPLAAEMVIDPTSAYSRYNQQSIMQLSMAQAGGDPVRATSIYREIDSLRATYVSTDMPWTTALRLSAAERNGDLPLMTDFMGREFYARGLAGQESAEARATMARITDVREELALPGQRRTTPGGRTIENIDLAENDAVFRKKTATAVRLSEATGFNLDAKKTPSQKIAEQSRMMADRLVRDIWGNVMTGQPNLTPGVYGTAMPGAPAPVPVPKAGPRTAGGGQFGPPPPTAPPPIKPPTAPAKPIYEPKPKVPKPYTPPKVTIPVKQYRGPSAGPEML